MGSNQCSHDNTVHELKKSLQKKKPKASLLIRLLSQTQAEQSASCSLPPTHSSFSIPRARLLSMVWAIRRNTKRWRATLAMHPLSLSLIDGLLEISSQLSDFNFPQKTGEFAWLGNIIISSSPAFTEVWYCILGLPRSGWLLSIPLTQLRRDRI